MIQAGLLNKQCIVIYNAPVLDPSGNISYNELGHPLNQDIQISKKCHIKDDTAKLESDNELIKYKKRKIFVFRKGVNVHKYRNIIYKGIKYVVLDIEYNDNDVTYEITCESIIE